ncbi:corrinoid methyltransferase [Spirochaetia bacterium]|nr:corrinoid methyltransferase [Spirochaetia bacterium]
MVDLNDISYTVQSGKARETSALVSQALEEHYAIEMIMKQGIIAGFQAVEDRYKQNEFLVPELRLAVRAMNWGIRQMRQAINALNQQTNGTVIIGTVIGDSEDIEKNLTSIMMEGMNLRVVDLGTGVTANQFIETAIQETARLIICSASMVPAMVHIKTLVHAAAAAGIREQVKILITGAPVSERFRKVIGADMYAPDTVSAAEMAAAWCLQCGGR